MEQGHLVSMVNLGHCLVTGVGTKQDYAEAVRLFQFVGDRHPMALNNLGDCYERGLGVRQDMREAARLYLKAAEQGVADAQASLAKMYEEGRGVKQDLDEAARWRQALASGGKGIKP